MLMFHSLNPVSVYQFTSKSNVSLFSAEVYMDAQAREDLNM